MPFKVSQIKPTYVVRPHEGLMLTTFIDEQGRELEVQLPIQKLNLFTQLLVSALETIESKGRVSNLVWPLQGDDLACEFVPVTGFRLLPRPREQGCIDIQFILEEHGLAGIRLSDGYARKLASDLQDNAVDYTITKEGDRIGVAVDIATYMDPRRMKSPSAPLPISERFCAPIGRILATWGQFQWKFELMLQALIKANNSDPMEEQGFKRWRDRFRDEAAKAFASYPVIAAYFKKLADDGGNYHWQRNAIAHGYYEAKLQTKKAANSDYIFVKMEMEVTTEHPIGTTRVVLYDKERLEKLYYRLAHLAGRMNEVSSLSQIENFPGSSQDKLTLREFLLANHSRYCKLATPQSPI